MLKPTRESDYKLNFLTPNKSDYRKKRTEIFYPDYSVSSIPSNTASEYKIEYKNRLNDKDKQNLRVLTQDAIFNLSFA